MKRFIKIAALGVTLVAAIVLWNVFQAARTAIDFKTSPAEVAAMSVDDFQPIRQREPRFPTVADGTVQALIESNRERLGLPSK